MRRNFILIFGLLGAQAFAQRTPLLSALLTTQASFTEGSVVQQQINDAIAAGQATYTMPTGQVRLTTSLVIKGGVKNFTVQGNNTVLVRNSNSDFPLILVGPGYSWSYDNSSFFGCETLSVQPVASGSKTIQTNTSGALVPGWYAIIGNDPVNDVVKHTDGNTQYAYKRELVRVIAVNGNVGTLDRPLGREYQTPLLKQLQTDDTPGYSLKICENITIKKLYLNGKSLTNNSLAKQLIRFNGYSGVHVDDVTAVGFNGTALYFALGNGAYISNSRVGDASNYAAAYGIEFAASRFSTVKNCQFTNHRWGTIFQMGSMDSLVEDCVYANTPNGGFDCGHGQDSRRITFRRCIAPTYSIANPSWRRGDQDVTLEDCSAYGTINIFGNAKNIVIRGKYPTHPNTAQMIQFFRDGGGSGIPQGISQPISVTLENGSTSRTEADGVNFQFLTLSGQKPGIEALTIKNWTAYNGISSKGAVMKLPTTETNCQLSIQDSFLENSYLYSAPITVAPAIGSGAWNISLVRSEFQTPSNYAISFETGARGNLSYEESNYNGAPLSSQNLQNMGTLQTGPQ